MQSQLPVEGVDLILGNDLAGGKVFLQPIFVDTHEVLKELAVRTEPSPSAFPVCVVTRAQTRNLQDSFLVSDGDRGVANIFVQPELMLPAGEIVHENHKSLKVGRKHLAMLQKSDCMCCSCY